MVNMTHALPLLSRRHGTQVAGVLFESSDSSLIKSVRLICRETKSHNKLLRMSSSFCSLRPRKHERAIKLHMWSHVLTHSLAQHLNLNPFPFTCWEASPIRAQRTESIQVIVREYTPHKLSSLPPPL